MKNLILIYALLFIVSNAYSAVDQAQVERYGIKTNQYQIDNAYVAAPPSAHYVAATSASFDPFITKTNKYAETKLISVVADTPILVKFSAAGTAVATSDAQHYIATGTREYFVIDDSYPYVRIISVNGNSARVYVTEIK